MTHFKFQRGGNKFTTIPKTSGWLNSQNVYCTGNDSYNPTGNDINLFEVVHHIMICLLMYDATTNELIIILLYFCVSKLVGFIGKLKRTLMFYWTLKFIKER